MVMIMQPKEIKELIESQIPNAIAHVEGNDGTHFQAIVISEQFVGKSRVQKQQLVYNTVKDYLLNGTLHALTTKTFTPEEWQSSHPINTENHGKI